MTDQPIHTPPIGPRYEYVNPQGVLFHARSGAMIAILKLAERS